MKLTKGERRVLSTLRLGQIEYIDEKEFLKRRLHMLQKLEVDGFVQLGFGSWSGARTVKRIQ